MNLRFADKLVFGLLFIAAFLLLISLLFFNYGEALAFYVLSLTMLVSAFLMVSLRDVIRSAFLMALTFISLGGLYVILNAGFLAAAQILIYAGAVAILFVFGVMLTRKGGVAIPEHSVDFRSMAAIFTFVGLGGLFVKGLWSGSWNLASAPSSADLNTVSEIGRQFFGPYIVPFELASVILLMALIGAIVIARKEEDPNHG